MTTENTPTPNNLISHKDACRWLNVKDQTLRNWRSTGRPLIPFIKVGRSVKYRLDDLQAFTEQNRVSGKK